jgi:AraC family transcriptional regulator, arabinose operon regulatory protein
MEDMNTGKDNLEPATRQVVDFVLENAKVRTNLCSRQVGNKGYTLVKRTVPDYNLIFNTRGRLVWVIEGHEHVMEAGEMVLVRPGVWHSGYSLTQRMGLGSLHFEMTLGGGQDAMEMLILPREMRFGNDGRMKAYLTLFMKEFDRVNRRETEQALAGWGDLIARELVRKAAREGSLKQRAVEGVVVLLLEEITRRIHTPTTLEDLARIAGFSAQHLNRIFNKALGVTPLRYLNRLRMDVAGALLKETALSVKAVGERLTFDDPYYFSRMFRQHHGVSPAQYRSQLESFGGWTEGSKNPSLGSVDPFTG